MDEVVFLLLLGGGIGALYAMLAAGLVVIYNGSGVINFAHGAMAMYSVATFDRLWHRGEIFLPWVDIFPTHGFNLPVRLTINGDGGVPMGVAFAVAVVMSMLLGLLAHQLVFKPLRDAAPLAKVVASLGLALYLQGVALRNFGTNYPVPESLYPTKAFENFMGLGRPFPLNTVMAVIAAVLFGTVVWGIYRYTRFGIATRAASENEKGAVLLGYSPQRLAAVNWMLGSVMAGTAAILVGPIQGQITPPGLTALIVPALAAALVGRLSSVPIAMLGGLALGMAQTLLEAKKLDWFEWTQIADGITSALPLLIIVAVLFFNGDSLPSRGSISEKRLPLSPLPIRVPQHAVVWLVVATFMAFTFEDSGRLTVFAGGLQTMFVFSIIALSLVVLTGYTGQISLFQMSMAGIAAFFMARMMADGSGQGTNLVPVSGLDLPWPLAALAGIALAVVVGVLLGAPAVRIRGVQLAVVTIAAAIAIQDIYLDNQQLTGLVSGAPADVKVPTAFGMDIGARSERFQNDNPKFIVFEVLLLIGVAVAIANLRRAGTGRRFLAIRANEMAAAAAGINVARTKLLAFAISSAIAGLGGVMLAFKQVQVSSLNFPYTASLAVLAFAYLGGITSINGGIVAGALVAGSLAPVFSNYFYASAVEDYLGIIGGLGMIVTAIVHPEGIAPFVQTGLRQGGTWLVNALPGMRTVHDAFVGRERRRIGAVLIALLVGTAVWLYQLDNVIVDNNFLWAVFTAALVWALLFAFAKSLGPVAPTFGEAGMRWREWIVKFGPTAALGYAAGWVIWPLRSDQYSKLYLPLVGLGLALMIRSIGLRVFRAMTGREDPSHAPTPSPAPVAH